MSIPDASLRVLAGWSDRFAAGGPIGRWQGGERDSTGAIQMPWYEYSDEMNRFVSQMYEAELVQPVDWTTWRGTPNAQRLIADPAAIAAGTADDLVLLLTTIIRGERFSDGEILGAYERGTLLAIADRARTLLEER